MEKEAKEKTRSIKSSTSSSSNKPSELRQTSGIESEVSSLTTKDEKVIVKPVKLPPIKAPVGLAKGPDLKACKSKVGSLNNIKHKPIGGKVTIESQKLKWSAKSKVGSLENKEHKPGGGKIKVETQKLQWNTTSKVQSLENVHHKPGGGKIKIFNESYAETGNKSSSNELSAKLSANLSADSSESSSSKAATTTNVDKQNNMTTKSSNMSIAEDMKSLKI